MQNLHRHLRIQSLGIIVACLALVWAGQGTAEAPFLQDLPIRVPDLPAGPAMPRNRVTFEQVHTIVGPDAENRGLVIDLQDAKLQGTIYTGLYPFALGKADYDYSRFHRQSRLDAGRGTLPIAALLSDESYPTTVPEPFRSPTPTIAYRLDLRLSERPSSGAGSLGLYDGLVSFRRENGRFVKNLTIVEGPFVTMKTSDNPESLAIAWETDQPCKGTVTVCRIGGTGDLAKPGKTEYRAEPPRSYADAGAVTRHQVAVTGLQPGARYLYQVQCEAQGDEKCTSGVYSFQAAPPPGKGSVTFAFTGDSRQDIQRGEESYMGVNLSTMSRIALDAFRRGADFLLFAGDLANGYTPDKADFILQLKGWKQAVAGFWRSRPVYPGMGNHDSLINSYRDGSRYGLSLDKWPYPTDSAEAVFASEFFNPGNGPKLSDPRRPPYNGNVYKFQFGPLLVVAFNNDYWSTNPKDVPTYGGSPRGYIMADQLAWIENALREADFNPTVRCVVLFGHQPVFPCEGHVKDYGNSDEDNKTRAYTYRNGVMEADKLGIVEVRNRLWRAISRSTKVAAVLTAHEHLYHRTLITDRTPVGVYPKDDVNGDGVLDTRSPDPEFVHPTWHLIVGTAGAPYSPCPKPPWPPAAYSLESGYALFTVDSERVSLKFISIMGQVLDAVPDLMEAKKGAPQ
ncbi:MAG: metallophosphoesterase family protein [Desulfomonile tiedjei]|nr:metallophosphoesterase family protein [Desulfomonile tiedjei]